MQTDSFAEDNIAYWTKRAPGYSGVNRGELSSGQRGVWSALLASEIKARFADREPRSLRVLDVGTGPGFFAVVLAELGFRVTAVDYTAAMLEEARRNALEASVRIEFMEMDAEQLDFPSESFDVVVSRNLTWNLRCPSAAYGEWVRVLKNGGLLLNFDANWYRYLYDKKAEEGHLRDRRNVAASDVADDTEGTDVRAMEAIARRAPLSAAERPKWDLDALASLGMRAAAEPKIWELVWTREEFVNNASTPMFMIRAEKPLEADNLSVERRPHA